jgi:hypothetical protein|tara:strand:+ start:1557 stop:2096 length:540 start_codon:yes stop_codon:yes gene_type:complete
MKNLLWIVVAAVVVGGGYMLYSGSSPKELMDTATDVVNAPAALEAASNAVGDAVDATEGAVDGAVDAASDATASSAEAATTEAATDTAAAADETATDAVAGTAEAVTDTAAATAEAASGGMADLLSVDGFDLDKVSEMIDGSEIGAFQKIALKTALEKAKDNPEVLQTVLDKIKEAAGL